MTLIAFSANKNRADILTDSWSYSGGGRLIGSDSKVHAISHLDMAHATQGSCVFEALWNLGAIGLAMHVGSFDGFVQEAGPYLRKAWNGVGERDQREPSVVFVLGYSGEESRFRAYQFDSGSDFERQDLEAPFIIPTPGDIRPSELELARLKGSLLAGQSESDRAEILTILENWHQKPGLVAPTTVKGWVQLGKHARESRAMAPADSNLKVFVAGDLYHAVLKRGEFTTTRVHRFNDSGAEFAQLVAGTLHPISQYGPCGFCDSGRPYVDCHLDSFFVTQSCPCGSDKPFQACCSVRAETVSTTGSNEPVECPASTLADAVSVS
jgi:hypothetical protein